MKGPPLASSPSSSRFSPSPLSGYGWNAGLAADFGPLAAEGLVPARVVRVYGLQCDVVTAAGDAARVVRAGLAPVTSSDPLRWVCTGDWAGLDPAGDPPVLRHLMPRRTALVRGSASERSEGQVLAANVDLTVIVVSLAAELDLGRVERFLALAWESGARPLVALTKADLVPDPGPLLADTEAVAPGVPVLLVSAVTGQGVAELAAAAAGGTCVLLGQSGVGKSTLANALLGTPVQEVGAVREVDDKGRHTTTTRDLLPLPGGGVLIDTPGLRGVALWDADSGVSQAFSDIEELAADCRFHDCSHTVEPDCAIQAALRDGTLRERRLDSYRRLQRENAWIASRSDARLRAEQRRVWKQRSAQGRAAARAKRDPRER